MQRSQNIEQQAANLTWRHTGYSFTELKGTGCEDGPQPSLVGEELRCRKSYKREIKDRGVEFRGHLATIHIIERPYSKVSMGRR